MSVAHCILLYALVISLNARGQVLCERKLNPQTTKYRDKIQKEINYPWCDYNTQFLLEYE